jgi:MFS family permease
LYNASTSVECSFKANVWSLAVVWRVVVIAACFESVCACSVIVFCCLLTVSINGFTWASTCVLILSSTISFMVASIVSHIFSERIGMILLRTSGLVRASNTLSVIVFPVLGAFLGMMSVRSEIEFRSLICLFLVFLSLGGHRDYQVKLLY